MAMTQGSGTHPSPALSHLRWPRRHPADSPDQMAEWQRAAGLDLAQRKTGVQILDVGQVDQHVACELAEAVEVAADHLELEGAGAADVVAADDFGDFPDGLFQGRQHVARVLRSIKPYKGQHAQTDLVAVDLG